MDVVIYLRASTKLQKTSFSIQRQLIDYYYPCKNVLAEFKEFGSGDNVNRAKLNLAIKHCIKHNCILIVASSDRLTRSIKDAVSIYDQLQGRIIACDIPNMDKTTFFNKVVFAERELELIRLRSTLGQRHAVATKGQWRKSRLSNDARKKASIALSEKAKQNKNNKQAKILCHMYRDKPYQMSLQQIADKLNDLGFKTAKGFDFKKTTVKRLIDRK